MDHTALREERIVDHQRDRYVLPNLGGVLTAEPLSYNQIQLRLVEQHLG